MGIRSGPNFRITSKPLPSGNSTSSSTTSTCSERRASTASATLPKSPVTSTSSLPDRPSRMPLRIRGSSSTMSNRSFFIHPGNFLGRRKSERNCYPHLGSPTRRFSNREAVPFRIHPGQAFACGAQAQANLQPVRICRRADAVVKDRDHQLVVFRRSADLDYACLSRAPQAVNDRVLQQGLHEERGHDGALHILC